MTLSFKTLHSDHALAILYWRYTPPYDFYNFNADTVLEDLCYLLYPENAFHAILNPLGERPGRGGTCQTSSWEQSFFLATFWMLNLLGWLTFYWHWKHLGIWQGNVAQFNENSTYLMGWFRDYLWANSAQVINGYNPYGVNNQSVWDWMFLFGHLVWATDFMFLIA